MSKPLKNCPFCGSEVGTNHPPSMWEPGSAKADISMTSIHCRSGCCYTHTRPTAEAAKVWNHRTNDQAKDEEIAELVEALAELWRVIDIAGLSNLANGVQLGQVSWFVKASDAVEQARAALAKHQDKSCG